MDGFDQTVNVKVIMATNRADTLDPALLRPGRLDRKIEFPLPDRRQKRLVFQVSNIQKASFNESFIFGKMLFVSCEVFLHSLHHKICHCLCPCHVIRVNGFVTSPHAPCWQNLPSAPYIFSCGQHRGWAPQSTHYLSLSCASCVYLLECLVIICFLHELCIFLIFSLVIMMSYSCRLLSSCCK